MVAGWAAARRPDAIALVGVETGRQVSWAEFDRAARRAGPLAGGAGLPARRFSRHANCPFSVEHVLLEYGCFHAGVIHTPLDQRLPAADVERAAAAVRARAVFRSGDAARALTGDERAPLPEVPEDAGAQVIFTTGSTGSPKPALLSHRNITCQNLCLGTAFGFSERGRMLVNLPPSHVGGQAEELMTTLFFGGTAVLLEGFDAARSLDAIAPPPRHPDRPDPGHVQPGVAAFQLFQL